MHSRSILITGCSSGIGLCAARGLAARGHRVIASARGIQDVERLRDEGIDCVRMDLADSHSIGAAADEVERRTEGNLDALFNNAAYGQVGAVEDLSRDMLREQFETNLFGTHELTCRIIPMMRRRNRGRIIQNSSVLGMIAMPFRGAYVASKFALEGLSDTLRMELIGTGIDVVLIEPGPINTRFRANSYAVFRRTLEGKESNHRETYRAMVERLASDEAKTPFTLPPEAVLERVIEALESPSPRLRYYVTVPTYAFALLRRVLPYRWLDRAARAASGAGRR